MAADLYLTLSYLHRTPELAFAESAVVTTAAPSMKPAVANGMRCSAGREKRVATFRLNNVLKLGVAKNVA